MGVAVVRYRQASDQHWGVLIEDRVAPWDTTATTLAELLAEEPLPHMLADLAAARLVPDLPIDSLALLSPVTTPAQVVAQGFNYSAHRAEADKRTDRPAFNLLMAKGASAVCGPRDDIVRPDHVLLLDYEVELGLVISRAVNGPWSGDDTALLDVVAGIVVANDVSAREVQFAHGQFFRGKSYRTFCPVGPVLYLLEHQDLPMLESLELRLWVNDTLRQEATIGQMHFRPAETLRELTAIVDLAAGDLILTGTPAGSALAERPPVESARRLARYIEREAKSGRYLQPGDLVRAQIRSADGAIDLGLQENRVVAADGSFPDEAAGDDAPRSRRRPLAVAGAVLATLLSILWIFARRQEDADD